MISSQEFQQQLQAGKIHAALALLVRDASELDITTRMTEDNTQSASNEYLRTKINLLTGDVQDRVSSEISIDSTSYQKLQQLHTERIAGSYEIVRDYLARIQTILTELSSQNCDDPIDSVRLDSDLLTSRLTQTSPLVINHKSRSMGASSHTNDVDNDIDLSVDEDGEVWEEWVEHEDSISSAIESQPASVAPILKIPDWEENLVRRQLNPIDVKPTIPRATSESVTTAPHWDKFAPEYVGISADPQPQIDYNNDSHLMDKLLADLDL
jgi:hypothetical protein